MLFISKLLFYSILLNDYQFFSCSEQIHHYVIFYMAVVECIIW